MAFLTCDHCGATSPPVECEGSMWCRDCAHQRSDIVFGDDVVHGPTGEAYLRDEYSTERRMNHAPPGNLRDANSGVADMSPESRAKLRERLDVVGVELDIPDIVLHDAAERFSQLQAQRHTRGNVQAGLLAHCVKDSCVRFRVTRDIARIKRSLSVSNRKFNKSVKFVAQHRDVATREPKRNTIYEDSVALHVYQYCIFVEEHLRQRVASRTIEFLDLVRKKSIQVHGKTPAKLAATGVMIVCEANRISLCKKSECVYGPHCTECLKCACNDFTVGRSTMMAHYKHMIQFKDDRVIVGLSQVQHGARGA